MATFDYARSIATADRLIAKFGRSAAIRRTSASGDAWNPTVTTADTDCTVVLTDYADSQIDGTLVRIGDRKALVAVESHGIVPGTSDHLVIATEAYAIVRVMPLDPGGTVVMWEIQVRR